MSILRFIATRPCTLPEQKLAVSTNFRLFSPHFGPGLYLKGVGLSKIVLCVFDNLLWLPDVFYLIKLLILARLPSWRVIITMWSSQFTYNYIAGACFKNNRECLKILIFAIKSLCSPTQPGLPTFFEYFSGFFKVPFWPCSRSSLLNSSFFQGPIVEKGPILKKWYLYWQYFKYFRYFWHLNYYKRQNSRFFPSMALYLWWLIVAHPDTV